VKADRAAAVILIGHGQAAEGSVTVLGDMANARVGPDGRRPTRRRCQRVRGVPLQRLPITSSLRSGGCFAGQVVVEAIKVSQVLPGTG